MEEIFEVLKEFENEGITIECGWKENERKKRMSEAMKKIKESGDENKIKLAKRLARYYGIFHNMGPIATNPEFPSKEDKYGLHYVHVYLEDFVDTAKRSIAGVIKAFADDEELDPFCKYLMFTHLYTPEQVKKIEHEEIYEKEKKFKKDEGLCDSDHDDGNKVREYVISGFRWDKDRRNYVTVSREDVEESDDDEIVDIPVPITLDEEWLRRLEEFNSVQFPRNLVQ